MLLSTLFNASNTTDLLQQIFLTVMGAIAGGMKDERDVENYLRWPDIKYQQRGRSGTSATSGEARLTTKQESA